jgi:hypothetical protein
MPMSAVPASPMMVRTSAKSTLMSPGLQNHKRVRFIDLMRRCESAILYGGERVRKTRNSVEEHDWRTESGRGVNRSEH